MTDDPRYGGDADGAGREGSALSTGTTFSLLADRHRRQVLAYLAEMEGDVAEVADVADHLADEGLDRRRAATALYHVHLPKLADAGVVEYDRRSGTIRYEGDASVESALAVIGDADLPLP